MKTSYATPKTRTYRTGTSSRNSYYRKDRGDITLIPVFVLVVIAIVMAVSSHPEWFVGL